MSKYKIGDKIKIRSWDSLVKEYGVDYRGGISLGSNSPWFAPKMKKYCGCTLTVRSISYSGYYRTEANENGYYWHFSDAMIETANPSIVIYANGNVVTAVDKSTGKTAEAFCNPNDKFDFYTGASIAYERLRGRMTPARAPETETKPKYFTGEMICTLSTHPWYTKGKIYKVEYGVWRDDDGDRHEEYVKTVEEINEGRSSKFLEVIR